MKEITKTYIYILLYTVISFIVLFPHLGSDVFYIWDESRVATNSVEMYYSNDWITATYDYSPEHWNTKPTLLVWLQCISMHIFGVNEFAIRFPSALAFLAMGLLYILGFRRLGKMDTGFFFAVSCLCIKAWFQYHCFRTGDYDGMLICFIMLYVLYFYLFTQQKKQKDYILFFVFVFLGVMTKSVQALFVLPALLIYVICTKQVQDILKNKVTYYGIAACILLFGSYLALREFYYPGYIVKMLNNDVFGRFSVSQGGHSGPFLEYWNNMSKQKVQWVAYLAVILAIINLFAKKEYYKKTTIYFLIITVNYFLVISFAQTKLEWYAYPLYAMLSVLIGIDVNRLLDYCENKKRRTITAYLSLSAIIIPMYVNVATKSFHSSQDRRYYAKSILQRRYIKGKYDYPSITYVTSNGDYDQSTMVYFDIMKGKNIPFRQCDVKDLHEGETVQVFDWKELPTIDSLFEYNTLEIQEPYRIIRLTKKKVN